MTIILGWWIFAYIVLVIVLWTFFSIDGEVRITTRKAWEILLWPISGTLYGAKYLWGD